MRFPLKAKKFITKYTFFSQRLHLQPQCHRTPGVPRSKWLAMNLQYHPLNDQAGI